MSKDFQITFGNLSAAESQCLDYVVSDRAAWLNGILESQISFARAGIINALKEHCFASGLVPAETDDGKIAQAFELGLVKTAAEVYAELQAAQAAQQE